MINYSLLDERIFNCFLILSNCWSEDYIKNNLQIIEFRQFIIRIKATNAPAQETVKANPFMYWIKKSFGHRNENIKKFVIANENQYIYHINHWIDINFNDTARSNKNLSKNPYEKRTFPIFPIKKLKKHIKKFQTVNKHFSNFWCYLKL